MKMTVYLDSQKVMLNDNNYLTSGGEGDLYKKDQFIIKIYKDIHSMNVNKILQLKDMFQLKEIITPKGLVYSANKQVIGYYMPFIAAESIVKTFSNDWRNQNNFDNDKSIELISNMRAIQEQIHAKKVIMVDANEMNYLFKDTTPYYLDSDSWQFDNYSAKVIMPSIRDWHSQSFTELSDWFSWGIVSFQVLTGIHPYKGFHKIKSFEDRMKKNISVFNPEVKLNSAVRDFNLIPNRLKEWYVHTFEKGLREKPPAIVANTATIVATKRTVYVQDILKFTPYLTMNEDIQTVNLAKYVKMKLNKFNLFTKQYVKQDQFNIDGEDHYLSDIKNKELLQTVLLTNKFYNITDSTITQLKVFNDTLMPYSTYEIYNAKVYSNVIVSEIINTVMVVLLHDKGKSIGYAPELKNFKIIDCYSEVDDYFLALVQDKNGQYFIQEYQFDYDKYVLKCSTSTDMTEINATFLTHKKLLVMCTEDNKLIVKHYPSQQEKCVLDKNMCFKLKLFSYDQRILVHNNREILEVTMK